MLLEVKSEGIYWKWGWQGNVNSIEYIRELKIECCLLLPKLPSADWDRCVCVHVCLSVCLPVCVYVFLEQQESISFFVDQMQGTERSNHITTRWKLSSRETALSPSSPKQAWPCSRGGWWPTGPRSPLFNQGWGPLGEPRSLSPSSARLPRTQLTLTNKFRGLTLPEPAGLCPQFHWDGPLKTHYKLFRLWLWLLLGSEQN